MLSYPNIESMLSSLTPVSPVYCVHPRNYAKAVDEFLSGFPGRVLYAVKANSEPAVVQTIYEAGVRHFDCASLTEIELVSGLCPGSTCYFMNPIWLPGAARAAFEQHGVRHFVIDHPSGLAALADEISPPDCVIFARLAAHHGSATVDLSTKFGAPHGEIPDLLTDIRASGAEPALAFNVGSGVLSPEAYRHAMGLAANVLSRIPFRIRLLDIGGGFPKSYLGYEVPPLADFLGVIQQCASTMKLADNAELLAEPGRSLAARGVSTVVRVLMRKDDRIYINDGLYGSFWELRFDGHKQYPVRTFRNAVQQSGESSNFTVFGPTCDSWDQLPEKISLPRNIAVGDYLEFASTGAYSLSGRTDFNGFYSDTIVLIDSN